MPRPYLMDDGRVEVKLPRTRGRRLREFANRYSLLAQYVAWRFDRLLSILATRWTVERELERDGLGSNKLSRATRITETLLRRVRRLASGRPVVAFVVDSHRTALVEAMETAALAAALHLSKDVGRALAGAEQRGVVTRAADRAHWNPAGHRVAADALLPSIVAQLHRDESKAGSRRKFPGEDARK